MVSTNKKTIADVISIFFVEKRTKEKEENRVSFTS